MHARKAHHQLNELAKAPANIDTYTKAAVLIDGLLRRNARVLEANERLNETVKAKLKSARGWFEILCGIGEDGDWGEQQLRDIIRADLHGAAMHITGDGYGYQAWAATKTDSQNSENLLQMPQK
jgi:hypothetical protein